jgi:hypothetical protein
MTSTFFTGIEQPGLTAVRIQRDANIRENVRDTHWKVTRVTPTTRRQNISRTPPIAASADAIGMIVSGPMYIAKLLHRRRYRHCVTRG